MHVFYSQSAILFYNTLVLTPEKQEMQAMILDRDRRLAELSDLHDELEEKRRIEAELKEQIARSQEMDQSEKERLVCSWARLWIEMENAN